MWPGFADQALLLGVVLALVWVWLFSSVLVDGVWSRSAVKSLFLFLALLPVLVLALVTTLYTLHCRV